MNRPRPVGPIRTDDSYDDVRPPWWILLAACVSALLVGVALTFAVWGVIVILNAMRHWS